MNEMISMKETIMDVTNAIHSVLQVDVTVIDKEYNRIAATGHYIDQIGEKVAKNSVFYKALKTGEAYIVESPREEEVCFDCERNQVCEEFAEVCCPIVADKEIVGIIGLVAFDLEQRDSIIQNKMNLLNFLEQMAHLISSKILENRYIEKTKMQSKEIEVLFNAIDTAVVSVSQEGCVIRWNHLAEKLLKKSMENCKSPFPYDQLKPVSDVLEVMVQDKPTRYLYQTKPIIVEGKLEQTVITFRKEKDVIHAMNDMVNMRHRISFESIIGKSKAFSKVIDKAKLASKSNSTVFIQGESGTGKELFARAIHDESERCHKPFVAINCAAIPESLIESELFGYTDGSFTGALKGGKPGKFEVADGGTIFLDEIGDMPIHLQSKLLRVLQEREVERIGAKYATAIDVRVIAATHQALSDLIEKKMFREDLFYRLNVIPIQLLPLRERMDDVLPLANFFLNRYNDKLNKNIIGFKSSVEAFFMKHLWKGNVREMENTVEYAVNMCQNDEIDMLDLPEQMMTFNVKMVCDCGVMNLEAMEKREIEKAMNMYSRDKEGVKAMTEALGISRATLYRKIKYYEL